VHLLGVAQLTKNGTATFKLRPRWGTNSYQAVFVGTANAQTSASPVASLAVTGRTVTSTTLAQSGASGNYTLTAEVGGAAATAPTGNVAFLDTTNSNAMLGTAALGAGTTGLTFLNSSNPAVGAPIQIATADFNGDGIPDLAVLSSDATVTVLLGNGDGRFTATPNSPQSQDNLAIAMTTGDFNRDGNADLAIVNSDNNTVTVLLGNGDGTFMTTPATTTSVAACGGFCPAAIVAADFNRDGILDLVTSAGVVLLGNGDGTFTSAPTLQGASGYSLGTSIAVGDFNGDGHLDLAMSNGAVFLGNGDGTFRAGTALPAKGPISTGDFNGDGIPDLAVANTPYAQPFEVTPINMVTILLGNGDGTFSVNAIGPSTSYAPSAVAVGDFNGDGIADLAVVNYDPEVGEPGGTSALTQISILLGDGKGAFTYATSPLSETIMHESGQGAEQLAVADFNGDGIADLAQPFWSGFEPSIPDVVNVLLAEQSTATAFVAGINVPSGHNVVGNYAGDNGNLPSTAATTSFEPGQSPSTLSLSLYPNPAAYGTLVSFSAIASGSGAWVTGTVSFYNGNSLLGTGSLEGAGAIYATSDLRVGTYSIHAIYGGDSNYSPSTSSAVMLTINKGVPTVNLAASANPVPVGAAVTLTATLTGGAIPPTGTITLTDGSSTLGTATLTNGSAAFTTSTLTLGLHPMIASYDGDGSYSPASSSPLGLTVTSTIAPTLTAPTPAPVSPGSSASAMLTLAAGTYSGTMTLTCALSSSPSGAQSLPTCTVNPASVTLAAGATATSVFTAKTTAATKSAAVLPFGEKFGAGVALAGLLMLGIARRRRQSFATLALLLLLATVLATGCGGGASSSSVSQPTGPVTPATTAGTYAFTVTGTDSVNPGTTITTKVTVTVQ
jgi:hypothetical protein